MLKLFDTLPFRAIRGTFQGLEDGMRGEIDTNQTFSDGYRENDPGKKSAAGQFLSDYSGIRGGATIGEKIGKWGGGLACGLVAANFLSGFVAAGMAAGALAGVFPAIATALLVGGAAIAGGALLGVAGKYIGGAVGMGVGGLLGAPVGLYNGVFRRGYYAKDKSPEQVPATPAKLPDMPQPAQNTAYRHSHFEEPAVVRSNDPRVDHILNNTPAPEGASANLAANGRVPNARRKPANMARAMQQVDSELGAGTVRPDAMQAPPAEGLGQPAQPRFADRVRQQVAQHAPSAPGPQR